MAPRLSAGSSKSSNWSGYAITGTAGSVTDVKASWVVPSVTCPTRGIQYSSFWIGIDGYNSNTVEQIGTDSDCSRGTPSYYAWYEAYPRPLVVIRSLTIHAGDVISAEVSFSGGKFSASITDLTTQKSFAGSGIVMSAQRSSAEWIAEAPSSLLGVLPLANFKTVYFSSCSATINGVTGSIGSFGGAVVQQIKMVNRNGADKAVPSSLSPDGTSFSVQWVSSAP